MEQVAHLRDNSIRYGIVSVVGFLIGAGTLKPETIYGILDFIAGNASYALDAFWN